MTTNTRIVLYKEANVDDRSELRLVDFGVASKVKLYEKLGYVVVTWIVEKVKAVVETADEKWSRFRRVVEAATKMIITSTQIVFETA